MDQSHLIGWLQRPRGIMDIQEFEKVKSANKLVTVRLCFA